MTPESRIDDLELRLQRYHEWLEQSIADRDRLALDAAWGVHFALYYNLVVVFFVIYLARYAENAPWWVSVLAGVGLFVVQMLVGIWSNGARMKEVDRLAKLPEWESRFG